jgi:hypothetical protein
MGEMFTGDVDAYAEATDRTGGRLPELLDYDSVIAPI